MGRISDFTRGVAALFLLAVTIAAFPALLWAMGGLPGRQIVDALTDGLLSSNARTEQLLSGTLVVIAWVCWVQVAYAIAIETIAAVRGATARRAAILPGVQSFARALVASVTLIAASVAPAAQASASTLRPLVPPVADLGWAEPETALVNPSPSPPTTSSTSGHDYVVAERDTFWGIAEATLGDGLRWSEVRDANVGSRMPDGTTITSSTETVQPGWTLVLPADASALLDRTVVSEPTNVNEVDVEPGDHFWSLAAETLEDEWGRPPTDGEITRYWIELVLLNEDRLLPPENPDVIYPGQELLLAPVPADPQGAATSAVDEAGADPRIELPAELSDAPQPVEVREAEAAVEPDGSSLFVLPTQRAAPPANDESVDHPAPPAIDHRRDEALVAQREVSDRSLPLSALAGIGATAVGAGALVLSLRRRRAYQSTKRAPGTGFAPADEAATDYERRVRAISNTEAVRWLEATNRLITHRLSQQKEPEPPAIVAMRAGELGVEILLDDEASPIDGFLTSPDTERTWILDAELTLDAIEAESRGAQPYAPALIPVGTTPAGELLLDFEQLGAVAVEGEPDAAIGWMRALATARAVTPWAQQCEIVALGLPDDIALLPNVVSPLDPDDWVRVFTAETQRTHDRLDKSPYLHRVSPGEVFHPTIVLVGSEASHLARALADVAALTNSPVGVVATAPLPTADRIFLTSSEAVLEPSGLAFVPAIGEEAELHAIVELLHNTNVVETHVVEQQQSQEDEERSPTAELAKATDQPSVDQFIQAVMAPQPIEVELLRPVPTITGVSKAPPTKQLSVICYLAFHRKVSSQRLRDAFWPHAPSRSTADNALAQVRRVLGTDSEGNHRLTTASNGGQYELSDEVGCDWLRAEMLITEAKRRNGDDAIRLRQAALGLVSGQIGADAPSRQFGWLIDDHDVYRVMEVALVDAAFFVGDALAEQTPAVAEAAVAQGLTVVPGHEALLRVSMRVAAAAGRFDEVERIFRSIEANIGQNSFWDDPDPETVALFDRIAAERRMNRAG